MMLKNLIRAAVLALATVTAVAAHAQDAYPENRPIRLVVPFPPGGAVDIVGRLIAPKLSEALGQNVVVENRGGANGTIGTGIVAKSAPDGHTILLSALGSITIIPQVQRVGYDPLKDLTALTQAVSLTLAWVSKSEGKVRSAQDLIRQAKAGATLSAGTSGNGSPNHLAIAQFNQLTGSRIAHVPYRGEGPALTDLLGGQIDLVVTTVVAAAPFIKDGRVVPLATGGSTRAASLPNVPTLQEAGISGYEADAWQGFFVPAATPRPIAERLQRELSKILKSAEVREFLTSRGTDPVGNTSEEFERKVRSEYDKYGKLIRAIDLKLE
ncbi:MAG: tripartite tricarboxylate transporter substrate binding protein [Burkholderiales bacterium]|nr:tripartite tricarboxylate transporter substrate binding protein [Burkholderiales bacterium]